VIGNGAPVFEDCVPEGNSPLQEAIEAVAMGVVGALQAMEARYQTDMAVSGEILEMAMTEFLCDVRDVGGVDAAHAFAAQLRRALDEFVEGRR
jgi:hypothetical protein